MSKKTFIPENYKLIYSHSVSKKSFSEYKRDCDSNLLSDVIRIELNNGFNSITGAKWLLRIRNKSNWKKCTLTGLRPTFKSNFYYADLPINNVKSLCVIKYNPNSQNIELIVCKQFYPFTSSDRFELIKYLIQCF